jgi:integrase
MSSSNLPPATLKGVHDAVRDAAYGKLSKARQSEWRSGIDLFARCVGRDPSELDANITALRAIERFAKPQTNNVSKAAYATALSRVKAALEYVGVPVDRRRDMPLSAGWADLLNQVEKLDEHHRTDLRKFAGWCSARDIAPCAVGQNTFADFFAFLQEQSVQYNYRERAHRARRAWNAAVAVEGADRPKIDNIFGDRPRRLRLGELPASFAEDARRYVAQVTKPSVLADREEPLEEVTAENYVGNLVLLAGSLVDDGVPLETLTSLRVLMDPDLVARGLDRMQANIVAERAQAKSSPAAEGPNRLKSSPINSKAWLPIVHATAYAAVAVAKDLSVDDATLAELRKIAKMIGSAFKKHRKGMTPKNKARLAQLDDPRVRGMFLNLPAQVFGRHADVAKPTFKHARAIQDATVLAVLQDLPIRVGNVAALDLERHFIRPIDGGPGPWRVSIPGCEVKNDEDIDCELTPEVSGMLDRYVRVFRPLISAKSCSVLLLSRDGKAKRETTISAQFTQFIRRELGLQINPHLMRHFCVNLWLKESPGDFETPRLVLAHTSSDTTRKSYAHLQQSAAVERYHVVVRRERAEAAALAQPVFRFGRRKRKGAA